VKEQPQARLHSRGGAATIFPDTFTARLRGSSTMNQIDTGARLLALADRCRRTLALLRRQVQRP